MKDLSFRIIFLLIQTALWITDRFFRFLEFLLMKIYLLKYPAGYTVFVFVVGIFIFLLIYGISLLSIEIKPIEVRSNEY